MAFEKNIDDDSTREAITQTTDQEASKHAAQTTAKEAVSTSLLKDEQTQPTRLIGESDVDFAAGIETELEAASSTNSEAKDDGSSFWSESDNEKLSYKQSLGATDVDFLADIDDEIARQKEGQTPPEPTTEPSSQPAVKTNGDGTTATGFCPKCAKVCPSMRFLDDGTHAWVFCMVCGWANNDAHLIQKMRTALGIN